MTKQLVSMNISLLAIVSSNAKHLFFFGLGIWSIVMFHPMKGVCPIVTGAIKRGVDEVENCMNMLPFFCKMCFDFI
jgi:hypothetical protein